MPQHGYVVTPMVACVRWILVVTSHTGCLLAAPMGRPWGMVAVAYRWIPEPYEGARYTVRKLRFRRIQIFNNLTCDILTQIRPLARDTS